MVVLSLKRESGFTLIELMIVVAIVGVLGAVAVPAFQKYIFDANEAEGTKMLLEAYRDQQRVKYDCQAGRYDCRNSDGTVGYYTDALASTDPTAPYLMYRPGGTPKFNLITGVDPTHREATKKYSLDELNFPVSEPTNTVFGNPASDNNGTVTLNRNKFLMGAEATLNGNIHLLAVDEKGTLFKVCDARTGTAGSGADVYKTYTAMDPACGSGSSSAPEDEAGKDEDG